MKSGVSPSRRRLVAALALAAVAPAIAQDPNASIAQRVAREWLAYADALDTKTAWDRAAEKFRASLPLATWDDALRKERERRGQVQRRTLVHTELRSDIPGYPAGNYALVVFRTEFANGEGQESVTVEREADGMWRVVGYVIR